MNLDEHVPAHSETHVLLRFQNRQTLDVGPVAFLHENLSRLGYDTKIIYKHLEERRVFFNEQVYFPSARLLKSQAWLNVFWSQPFSDYPESILAKKIVYEDSSLIVVDKPHGISTHATPKCRDQNLFDQVRVYLWQKDPDRFPYLGLLHRLDRDTSGLVLMTKDPKMNAPLARQFMRGRVIKAYVGLSKSPPPHFSATRLSHLLERWKDPEKGFRTRVSSSAGDTALSDVFCLGNRNGLQAFLVMPITGRTHQIRVQMSEAGHALCDDKLYGSGETVLGRLGLHAAQLHIYQHQFKKVVPFISSLPDEFLRAFPELDKALQEKLNEVLNKDRS